jgi:hypothetical protein
LRGHTKPRYRLRRTGFFRHGVAGLRTRRLHACTGVSRVRRRFAAAVPAPTGTRRQIAPKKLSIEPV